MSGIEIALLAGSAIASTAGGVMAAQGAQGQAKAGRAGIAMQREQLAIERDSVALQAKEQEAERRRRAGLTDSSLQAAVAAMGLDPSSGSIGTLQTENRRVVESDVGAIRLGATTRQRQGYLQDRSLALQGQVLQTNARNAWVSAGVQIAGGLMGVARASSIGISKLPGGSRAPAGEMDGVF